MRSRLDLSEEQIRAFGEEALRAMIEYYGSIAERRIMPPAKSAEIRALFQEALPEAGAEFGDLLRKVEQDVFANCRHNGHPRFFGYVASPGNGIAALADLVTSTLNSNVTAWRSSPAGVEMEHVVIGWLREMLGLPPDGGGLFVSGGSMANLAGIAAARAAKAPVDVKGRGMGACGAAMRLYVSSEAHFSMAKAAGLLGIGQDNVRTVATDASMKMDIAALERCIEEDLAAGHLPFCVVGSAGTVSTGAIDPLDGIADLAQRYGLWFHVDGAYGGFAALAPAVRPLFRGIERADSVALDPHKWLYSSMGCGCVLYRDPAEARRAFSQDADYTRPIGHEQDEAFAFWDYGPELSRGFRALTVWFVMKYAGARALGESIGQNLECAREAERLVRQSSDFEMLAPVELSVFCFRYAPPGYQGDLDLLNERVLMELQARGHSYVSNARVKGRFALRGCVLNYRTTLDDMKVLLDDVRVAADSVLQTVL